MRALLAVVAAVILFIPITWTVEFREIEFSARDVQARAAASTGSDRIMVVMIDGDDYDSLFAGRSPLDPGTLMSLLRALSRGRPRVIGVDIDTSDPSFEPLRTVADSIGSHGGPRIVWARDAMACADASEATPDGSSCIPGSLEPLGVLGREGSDVASGLVSVALDPGGTIRRFTPVLATTGGPIPGFAWAIWRAYDPRSPVPYDSGGSRFVTFHPVDPDAWHFNARQILQLDSTAAFARGDILGDRIVLLGGAYRAGRDEHHTPLGILPGVQIQALTVETLLTGGGAGVPSLYHIAMLQFLIGTCLALAFLQQRPGRALAIVLLAATGLVVVGSYLLTGSATAGLPYFVPLAVMLVVQQLHEQVGTYRQMFVEEAFHHATGHSAGTPVAGGLARVESAMAAAGRIALAPFRWIAARMRTPPGDPPPDNSAGAP